MTALLKLKLPMLLGGTGGVIVRVCLRLELLLLKRQEVRKKGNVE